MDFFESQERAKRNTSRLVAMFVVALLATMASYRWIETPALRLKARFRVPNVVERPAEVGQTN